MTGGSTTQSASAPFGTATRTLTIVGAVRRNTGSCNFISPIPLADGGSTDDLSVSCTISPAHQVLGHTALFFQATTSSGSAGTAMIRCRLTSTSQVLCDREVGNSSATVRWQTIELPRGFRVERTDGACQAPPPYTVMLPAAINPATTFLLHSYSVNSSSLDDDDLNTFRLMSGTAVEIDRGLATANCSSGAYDIQALEVSGISVTRGSEDAGMAIGATSVTVSGLTAASANTALLSSNTAPDTNEPICNVLVRSEMPTPSSLRFSRSDGVGGACAVEPVYKIGWERIDFGSRAKVQVFTRTLGIGTASLPVAISTVDLTRTIVFASSQAASGQSAGETTYAGGNNLSEGNARFELTSSTNVNVIRQRTSATGTFTFYVVEFDP